jgi:hypothetical protein
MWHDPARHGPAGRITLDIYSWPADFGGLAGTVSEELSRAGFTDVSNPGPAGSLARVFVRPAFTSITVTVWRMKFHGADNIVPVEDSRSSGGNARHLSGYDLQFSQTPAAGKNCRRKPAVPSRTKATALAARKMYSSRAIIMPAYGPTRRISRSALWAIR